MSDLPQAKKALGQHWLTDRSALEGIAEAATVDAGDHVLEIGPGTGTLTEVLLQTGAHVLALEFDHETIRPLEKRFAQQLGNQLRIEEGDIRSFDFARLESPYKIVANIPYYLTANLFRALVDTPSKPAAASLLVQKEVAERLAAQPGKMSFIAVAVQLFYEVDLGDLIPAYLFTPPPKVDSQVVILTARSKPLFDDLDIEAFFALVKAGFSERRKKLKTSIKTGVGRELDTSALLESAGVSPDARAQELSLEQWYAVFKASQSSL